MECDLWNSKMMSEIIDSVFLTSILGDTRTISNCPDAPARKMAQLVVGVIYTSLQEKRIESGTIFYCCTFFNNEKLFSRLVVSLDDLTHATLQLKPIIYRTCFIWQDGMHVLLFSTYIRTYYKYE